MHYQSLLAVFGLAATTLAAPLEVRDYNTTVTTDYFTPSARYHYHVNNGAIDCGVTTGLVSKADANQGRDITTLLTFTYPPAAVGKKCRLAFYLDSTATVTGSGKLDVFSSLQPAPGCTTGWSPGNQRNVNLGRWSVLKNAFATWDATYGAYLTTPTDCKPAGTQEGFELVGVYDNDYISWNPAVGAGTRIYYA
jgi:hypothetical protein